MRIGELSKRGGVAATALRYYEQLGLLHPNGRTDAGYRTYADDALDRLKFIRAAQAVGLTLSEVGVVIGVRDAGDAPCHVVTDLIHQRHADVRARISELQRLERDLASLSHRAATLESRDCEPSGICHVIPRIQ
jgi:MerR family transcriptional regulator, copper efflux regulator